MIIAECSTNWVDLAMAKEMIKVAKESGADLVKFQLFNAEDDKGKSHYDWVKAHELTFDQAKMLFDYGASIGQEVFFSVFALEYVEWCEKIRVNRYKIAVDFRDYDTWRAIGLTGKRSIVSYVSLGQETMPYGLSNSTFIYCPPGYPQKFSDLMFRHMLSSYLLGLSDHTIGLDAAKIALARGAQIIEKHFCLEHNPLYPDDAWSMTPEDLKELKRWGNVVNEVL